MTNIFRMLKPFDPTKYPNISKVWEDHRLVALPGFSGYYVDRFNSIIGFQSPNAKYLQTYIKKQGKYATECLQLYDDEGVRRLVSRRKLLITALGVTEYERREKLRPRREEIEAEEARVIEERRKEEEVEHHKELQREFRAYDACNCKPEVFVEWQRLKHDRAAQDAWTLRKEAERVLGDLF